MAHPRETGSLPGDIPQTTEQRALSLYVPTEIESAIEEFFRVPYGQQIRPLDIDLGEPVIEEVPDSVYGTNLELVRRSLPIVVTGPLGERTVVTMEYRRRSPFSGDWKETTRAYGEGKVAAERHGSYIVPQFTEDELIGLNREMCSLLADQDSDGYESAVALVDPKFIPGVNVRAFEETVRVGLFDHSESEDAISGQADLQSDEPNLGGKLARELFVFNSPLVLEPGEERSKYEYGFVWSFPYQDQEVAEILRSSRPRYFYNDLPVGSSTRNFAIKANYNPSVMIEMLHNMVSSRTQGSK